ncbi:MAG: von Willebrand factor type A domain-containing protein, partial [Gemmatimonadetes bacterium]|nr:von Willebrand factor type A domain-containing protein [Gemmatimonadota bacterium]
MRFSTLAALVVIGVTTSGTALLRPAIQKDDDSGHTTIAQPDTTQAGLVFFGSITDVRRSPIAGVAVRIDALGVEGTTGRDGQYRIAVPDLRYAPSVVMFDVSRAGWASVAREVRIQGDSVRADFVLVEAPERELAGKDEEQNRSRRSLLERAREMLGGVHATSAAAPMPQAVIGLAAVADRDPRFNTESYGHFDENPFLSPALNPLSTFSIDVDRASYSNIRRFIEQGQRPPVDAVRIEEMVNYFRYDYAGPQGDAPFSITTDLSAAPWAPQHHLLRIGLQADAIDLADMPPGNLVFLLDVSGSMQSPDKLPLLKQAFGLLVDQLREDDRVAIVVYAGAAGLVLPSTTGDRKDVIMDAINALEAGGSTAGGEGLRLAYRIARQNLRADGNNRVILATDGDFNVGESSDAAMIRLIEEERKSGVFLTVLGFGTGNIKDSKMEALADHGNGSYAYIDNLMEARKTLVHELGGTLLTVAKDVKLQVEFNPDRVQAYRLIGYENRLLAAEDFNDDTKDAGELGAGHTVTALYEIVPAGIEPDVAIRGVDSLRYTRPAARTDDGAGELGYVKLRYKKPSGDRSLLLEHAVPFRVGEATADFTFASAVAAFGMILRDSGYRGDITLDQVIAL